MELKTKIMMNRLVMAVASAVLLFAAVTKYWMIMTEPILSRGFWESRDFFIIHVFLTTGLAIWLVCGLFRKASWLLVIAAFTVFIGDTFYRAIVGEVSCGCFGRVVVDPWVTLFAINLPIIVLLLLFRPAGEKLLPPPWPSARHFFGVAVPTFILLGVILFTAFNYLPPAQTDQYKVVDNQEWIGTEFEMLSQIDAADSLRDGLCVILFYHNDCPNCREAIPVYSQIYDEITAEGNTTIIAFIEMPPYGDASDSPIPEDSQCITGRLDDTKKWYAATPLLVVIEDGIVIKSFEYEVPLDFDSLMESIFE